QAQFVEHLADLAALDRVEARFERRQEFLGNGAAGEGNANVAANLEIGHADRLAPFLQGQRVQIDLLANLHRVPGPGRFLQSGDRVFEVGRIAAQLGRALAILVVAIERTLDVVKLPAQTRVVAVLQRLLAGGRTG